MCVCIYIWCVCVYVCVHISLTGSVSPENPTNTNRLENPPSIQMEKLV